MKNVKLPCGFYNGRVYIKKIWLLVTHCLQGVPILKNVREKFCEKILAYDLSYPGVSINKFLVLDTFTYPCFVVVQKNVDGGVWLLDTQCLQGVPIMKNVREKFCEKFLGYVFS